MPPPNVTGALHMGHALNGTLQDVLVRWHRMRGFNALWQPGYDHAGIGTQVVVERELAKEGLSRHDVGREAFLERVWAWLEEYGGIIMGQYRRLGASLDYRRERFTMDPDYVRAVMRFFVHLYERGWIYRDNRMVNWCPRCATAISDLEVQHHEVDDTLTYVRYPLADGSGHVTVATVRPATILADVAVAVHPGDDRYRSIVGKDVIVPVVERRVPVIEDERVEPEFGTGALKITPGHDPVDFEIGRDHGLPEPMVIGLDGRMNGEVPQFEGLTQEEAGERVIAWLREHDQLERQEPYRHSVGHCERCGTRVEPLISLQWFCEMKELAAPAIDAVRDGRVRFHPAPAGPGVPRLDGEHPPVVHLAPALVGPPHSRLVLRLRRNDRRRDAAGALRGVRRSGAPPGRGRAGHLVLLRALAVRHARLAGRDAGAAHVLSRRRQHDGARDHLPLGGADDHGRPRAVRRRSRSRTSSSTRPCSRPTGGACRRASAPASTRST